MPLEKLTHCPLCKSGLFLNHSEIKDHSISKELFYTCKCSKCDLVFTNPRPDADSIVRYYESPEYVSHQNKSNSLINVAYKLIRMYTIRRKVNQINEYFHGKGSILDYGCGTGHFLKAAKADGWKVTGIEPNPTANATSNGHGVKTYLAYDELKKSKTFDIISLFHVLEHIHALRSTLKNLLKHLKTDGKLLIAVPNRESFDAQHYKEYWAAWDVPRHLYHFNQSSIQKLAEEFELQIESTLPMPFDAYYVSILSEKYQNPSRSGLLNIFRALQIGTKSNESASKKDNQYSSLLFILKKK
jgi:predicted SAM-dependent methyltransferase